MGYNDVVHTHGHLPSDVTDTVDLWVSDFLDRPAGRTAAAAVGEAAQDVLTQLIVTACDERGPAALSEAALSHALLDHATELALPAAAKSAVPDLLAAFLGDLEDVGRLSGGRLLASHVRALAPGLPRARVRAGDGPSAPRGQDRAQRPVPLRQRAQVQGLLPERARVDARDLGGALSASAPQPPGVPAISAGRRAGRRRARPR